jgi:hypothetical protein
VTEKVQESTRVHLLAASECLARCCPTSETVNAGWQRAIGRHWQILLDVNRLIAGPSQRCLRDRLRVAPSQFSWLSRDLLCVSSSGRLRTWFRAGPRAEAAAWLLLSS